MTVASPEKIFQEFVGYDEMGPFPFVGQKIAELSWSYAQARERKYTHWTDIVLYEVANAPYKYGVQILGRSSLYHRDGGSCAKGVRMSVAKLAEDDERYDGVDPCQVPGCRPKDLEKLQNGDFVWVEVDLPRFYRCRDVDALLGELVHRNRRLGKPVSNLNLRLLNKASLVDDDIKAAVMKLPR